MDKSLVLADEEEGGNKRYRMLETLRQYATEKREASGEIVAVQARHVAFFVALAEEAKPHLQGPDQVEWLNRLETEHDNLRASLNACAADAGNVTDVADVADVLDAPGAAGAALSCLRLSEALFWFWFIRGYLTEGREQIGRALTFRQAATDGAGGADGADESVVKKVVAGALTAVGFLENNQGDYAVARSHSMEGLRLYREIEDKRNVARALRGLGNITSAQGDYVLARSHFRESLSLSREIGHKGDIARALRGLGNAASAQGDYDSARSHLAESLNLHREIGDKDGIAAH